MPFKASGSGNYASPTRATADNDIHSRSHTFRNGVYTFVTNK